MLHGNLYKSMITLAMWKLQALIATWKKVHDFPSLGKYVIYSSVSWARHFLDVWSHEYADWKIAFRAHLTTHTRVTLYTAGHLHTAVPHCSHSRAPIVHTAVPRENNEHGCVYLRCRAVCKLPGCVEGHPWHNGFRIIHRSFQMWFARPPAPSCKQFSLNDESKYPVNSSP